MFNIVLFEPEIPPNTGNIIRLAANTSCQLHLIEPLGFQLDEKKLKRAGLDYHEFANVNTYSNFDDFLAKNNNINLYALSTKGTKVYSDIDFEAGDFFIFGPETRGLPESILYSKHLTELVTLPMAKNSRSLNLSNTVAIVTYEALRQNNFEID
ncbi:MAG: tRNA (uridine(34)/cytosine(34)/5-carboxymethylaminomethyluridine(34)-2'-O)-methyltransferase TrmL [Gammaproteobacteria bacterium]|nr:tRNA (uridine(34)/cytosine(34)/5-carboxymethylaminomethyluridine(34)-2'-O)-methyltransferase TrmL [Gammaproteobacteria bacterium]